MKKVYIPFFFLILLSSGSFAQNFFPMQLGNKYEWVQDWYWYLHGHSESGYYFYQHLIESDTLINGERFFRITKYRNGGTLGSGTFFYYDSLDQKLFIKKPDNDTIFLAVDFLAPEDSSFISYIEGSPMRFYSKGIYIEEVFGDSIPVFGMNWFDPPVSVPGEEYYFADNIGVFRRDSYWTDGFGFSEHERDLITAIIDSQIVNPLNLSIDSLYPAIDRPIDTFPFLLTIKRSSKALYYVDSFYLAYEHRRGGALVLQDTITLSNSNVTFYIDSLQVDDLINFKAVITDTSIHYNRDVYPDSSWITIKVLPPVTSVESETELPTHFSLFQNYPNPFNPTTKIRFTIPSVIASEVKQSLISLKVYDVLGNEVATLINEYKPAGIYEVEFSVEAIQRIALTSGVYFYQLKAGNYIESKKMTLMK